MTPPPNMNPKHWGLQQGLLGAQQATLSPSMTSVGCNRYLTRDDFLKMVALALVLHAVVIGIGSLFRDEHVTDIPVRALSFKIGDAAPRVAVSAPTPVAAPAPVAPVYKPVTTNSNRVAAPSSVWKKNEPAPRLATQYTPPKPIAPAQNPFVAPAQRQQPQENPKPLTPLPTQPATTPLGWSTQPPATPTAAPAAPLSALPDPNLLAQPAIAPNPQHFVRESNAPLPSLNPITSNTPVAANPALTAQQITAQQSAASAQSAEAARTRYEQAIAGWTERHKIYPTDAKGASGRVVVRIRIDRSGNLRYYGIEESSGNTVLDAAAIDMIRRANPMPAVPADYPAGNLIDFVIPINFSPH